MKVVSLKLNGAAVQLHLDEADAVVRASCAGEDAGWQLLDGLTLYPELADRLTTLAAQIAEVSDVVERHRGRIAQLQFDQRRARHQLYGAWLSDRLDQLAAEERAETELLYAAQDRREALTRDLRAAQVTAQDEAARTVEAALAKRRERLDTEAEVSNDRLLAALTPLLEQAYRIRGELYALTADGAQGKAVERILTAAGVPLPRPVKPPTPDPDEYDYLRPVVPVRMTYIVED